MIDVQELKIIMDQIECTTTKIQEHMKVKMRKIKAEITGLETHWKAVPAE